MYKYIQIIPLAFAFFSMSVEAVVTRDQALKDLDHGRAYRTDSTINKATGYRTPDLKTLRSRYVNLSGEGLDSAGYLIKSITEFAELLSTNPADNGLINHLSSSANELLRGQSMLGNDYYRKALEMNYPINLDSAEPSVDELRKGTSSMAALYLKEKPAYEQAILEYEKGIKPVLELFKDPKTTGSIRSTGSNEQYPQFVNIPHPNGKETESVLSETVQMTRMMRQWSLAHVSLASRLYLLGAKNIKPGQDLPDEAQKAKAILKRAGHGAYLQAVLLASKQDRETYQKNFGLEINSNISLARETFEAINMRIPPTGRPKDFITSTDMNDFVKYAQDSAKEALQWEKEARSLSKTYNENYLTSFINEMKSQQSAYKGPLEDISGIDVVEDIVKIENGQKVKLNNLLTASDLDNFEKEVGRRIHLYFAYPSKYDPKDQANDLGELANAILRVQSADIALRKAKDDLDKIPQQVEIINNSVKKIKTVINKTGQIIRALDLAIGATKSVKITTKSGAFPWPPFIGSGIEVSVDTTESVVAGLRTLQEVQTEIRELATLDANRDKEINLILLDISTAVFNIESAKNELLAANSAYQQLYDKMMRTIDDLRRAQIAASDAWFSDPSYTVELNLNQSRAKDSLITAIASIYDLAKAMGYYWGEDFISPVKDRGVPPRTAMVPVPGCGAGECLWEFMSVDDVFTITNAQSCMDAIQALKNWDRILRVGPGNGEPPYRETRGSTWIAQPLSLRRDLLNLSSYKVPQQVVLLRDYIEKNAFLNGSSCLFEFPVRLELYQYDNNTKKYLNPHFDHEHWNQTIDAISVQVEADEGFFPPGSNKGAIEVWLAVTGETTKRTYFGKSQTNGSVDGEDALKRITIPSFQRLDLLVQEGDIDSANKYTDSFQASVNGENPPEGWPKGYQTLSTNSPYYRVDSKLKNLPVGATGWYLIINAKNTKNHGININKLRDVKITISYRYGTPEPIFQ